MNKIALPALLVATIMVVGIFAFAPVEQASTIHTTTSSGLITEVETSIILDDSSSDTHTVTYTFNDDALVYGMQIVIATTDTGDDYDIGAVTVNGATLIRDTVFANPAADADIDVQYLQTHSFESVPLAIESGNTITLAIEEDDSAAGGTSETLTVTFVYSANSDATISASAVIIS